jgi:hypothetical protein
MCLFLDGGEGFSSIPKVPACRKYLSPGGLKKILRLGEEGGEFVSSR